MDREQFRRLVDERVQKIAGVSLDDLADVSLDDWLDDEDGIDDRVAEDAALEAAAELLEAEGLDDDVIARGLRMFGSGDREEQW